ncbi:MAG: hypothetical protein NVS4B3_11240 [Gemmatimonadaceae bacterium]
MAAVLVSLGMTACVIRPYTARTLSIDADSSTSMPASPDPPTRGSGRMYSADHIMRSGAVDVWDFLRRQGSFRVIDGVNSQPVALQSRRGRSDDARRHAERNQNRCQPGLPGAHRRRHNY